MSDERAFGAGPAQPYSSRPTLHAWRRHKAGRHRGRRGAEICERATRRLTSSSQRRPRPLCVDALHCHDRISTTPVARKWRH